MGKRLFAIISAFIISASIAITCMASPLPDVPNSKVIDSAEALDAETNQKLEALLDELENTTTAEVAVATVETMNGESIESYANALFKKWGVGQKDKDNGVLFLISTGDRKVRIEVGYGLEGALPDSKAGAILTDEVIPHFKVGDMKSGISAGTIAIARVVANEYNLTLDDLGATGTVVSDLAAPLPTVEYSESRPGMTFYIIMTFLVAAFGVVILIIVIAAKRGYAMGRAGGFSDSSDPGGAHWWSSDSSSGGSSSGSDNSSSSDSSSDSFGGGDSGGGGASGDW